jgi:hypothetical protein
VTINPKKWNNRTITWQLIQRKWNNRMITWQLIQRKWNNRMITWQLIQRKWNRTYTSAGNEERHEVYNEAIELRVHSGSAEVITSKVFTVTTSSWLIVTEYLCPRKWLRICSVCRYHNPVFPHSWLSTWL